MNKILDLFIANLRAEYTLAISEAIERNAKEFEQKESLKKDVP